MPDVEASFQPRLGGAGPFLPPSTIVVPMSTVKWVDPGTTVPIGEQNGTPGAPFQSIHAAVTVLDGHGPGTVMLAPGIYPAESVTIISSEMVFLGLGSWLTGCDLGAVEITSSQNVSLSGIETLSSLTTSANARVVQSEVRNPVEFGISLQAASLDIYDSTVGTVQISGVCTAFGTTFLNGGSMQRCEAHDSEFDTVDTSYTLSGGGSDFWSCAFTANLVAVSPTFYDSILAGAFTGGNYFLYNSRLQGGSVHATVQIAADLFSYQSAPPASWVATNGINIVDAPWSPQQKQIGWNASGVSNLLTLLVAGHAPGLYLVHAPFVVRTVATAGTATRTISWNAPTLGAQSIATTGFSLTTTGTKAVDVTAIESDGSADVTVRYSPVARTGTPAIDVYAASVQGGLGLLP